MTVTIPNTIANGDVPDATVLMGNFDYIENTLNDFDGGNVTDGTISDSALVNSPQTIRAETILSQVVSGLTSVDPGATLTAVIAAGVAYIEGIRVSVNSFSNAYTAEKDCYTDLDKNGTFHVTEVANGASEPAIYTNSIRVAKFVTNATEVTSYVDRRPLYLDGTWTPYTPVFTLTGAASQLGTIYGAYTQIGKTVHYRVGFTLSAASDFTGCTEIHYTLPKVAAAGSGPYYCAGTGFALNASVGVSALTAFVLTSTTARITAHMVSGTTVLATDASQGVPITFGLADRLEITGTYEAA